MCTRPTAGNKIQFSSTTTPPTYDAKVTVRFTGLMLLKANANNGCDIGIHHAAANHLFQAMVIFNEPGRPPGVFRLISGPLSDQMAINVKPQPPTGVQAFRPDAVPFTRDDAVNDPLDFRWAINLRTVYDDTIDFTPAATPIVTLNGGTLYTSRLSLVELDPKIVRDGVSTPLNRFSADLAAAIDGKVEISWHEGSIVRKVQLPRKSDLPGTTYTIVLINEPPNHQAIPHDELSLYNDVLNISLDPSATPKFARLSTTSGPSTDEVPCMPVIID
jgi:hypothetical protein